MNRRKKPFLLECSHNSLIQFCASSSEVPDSPSQDYNIDIRLGRSKISNAERLKYFARDHWQPSLVAETEFARTVGWPGKKRGQTDTGAVLWST